MRKIIPIVKRIAIALFMIILPSTWAMAQPVHKTLPAKKHITASLVKPAFISGGVESYLNKNIRYPEAAKENNVEGRVNVQFLIDEKGQVQKAKILGTKRLGLGLEEEALRVVRAMPAWKPAMYNKRPVKYVYTLPVTFRLE